MITYRDADGNKVRYCHDSPFPIGHKQHGEKIQFTSSSRPIIELEKDSFAQGSEDWWLDLLTPETRARLESR